jgi:FkbM family methyltransferase
MKTFKQRLVSATNELLDSINAGFQICKRNPTYISTIKTIFDAKGIEHPIIFDVGAFRGFFALEMHREFRSSVIHCYEPNPIEFENMLHIVGNCATIKPINKALGLSNSSALLNISKGSASSSLLKSDLRYSKAWNNDLLETVSQVRVNVVAGDDEFARLKLDTIDLLKIDAQGFEESVLKGFNSTIIKRKIQLIYLEILVAPSYDLQADPSSLFNLLYSHGYILAGVFNRLHSDTQRLLQFDALFELS